MTDPLTQADLDAGLAEIKRMVEGRNVEPLRLAELALQMLKMWIEEAERLKLQLADRDATITALRERLGE